MSKVFETLLIGSRLTGRGLFGSFSGFATVIITDFFHMFEKQPMPVSALKIIIMYLMAWRESSSTMLLVILSWRHAFLGSNSLFIRAIFVTLNRGFLSVDEGEYFGSFFIEFSAKIFWLFHRHYGSSHHFLGARVVNVILVLGDSYKFSRESIPCLLSQLNL